MFTDKYTGRPSCQQFELFHFSSILIPDKQTYTNGKMAIWRQGRKNFILPRPLDNIVLGVLNKFWKPTKTNETDLLSPVCCANVKQKY